MSRQRFIALLIAALVAISGALYLSTQRNRSRDVHGLPLLPSLAERIEQRDLAKRAQRQRHALVTVHKQGEHGRWRSGPNYPADVPKLRKLLLASERRQDPRGKNFRSCQLFDHRRRGPDQAGRHGRTNRGDCEGRGSRTSLSASPPTREALSDEPARRPATSLSRRSRLKPSRAIGSTRDFSTSRPTKYKASEFKPATGPGYTLRRVSEHRRQAREGKGSVNTLTPAAAAAAPSRGARARPPAAAPRPPRLRPANLFWKACRAVDRLRRSKPWRPRRTFSAISATMTSRRPATSISASRRSAPSPYPTAASITFTGAAVGEKRWIQVAAPKDASLSAKTNGRAFEIATYRYDAIFRPLEQLLVPKPPPPSAKPSSGAKPAASSAKKPPDRAQAVIGGASAGFGTPTGGTGVRRVSAGRSLDDIYRRRSFLHARRGDRTGHRRAPGCMSIEPDWCSSLRVITRSIGCAADRHSACARGVFARSALPAIR